MKRLLDMYCGAGGAGKGYSRAGFEVTGIDIEDRGYPFEFQQRDALKLEPEWIAENFDLVHASPPCQFAQAYGRRPNHCAPAENLIPDTRKLLQASGLPYVIENVHGARHELIDPVMLCGSHFDGLDVQRHRYFETSFYVLQPDCNHDKWASGRYPPATNRTRWRKTAEIGAWRIPLETQVAAMGGDLTWMSLRDLSLAIPSAYTLHIGKAFLANAGR